MKNISTNFLLLCLFAAAWSCKKNSGGDQPPVIVAKKKMVVKASNETDTLEVTQASYFRQWKQVYLIAEGGVKSLQFAINLKPGLTGTYSFAPNGDNCVIWNNGAKYYFTELDAVDAGGTLAVSNLDTVALTIKGTLHVSVYLPDLKEQVTIDAVIPDSLKLEADDSKYNGNWSSMTIQGAASFSWYARDIYFFTSCSGKAAAGFDLNISSMYGPGPNARFASIRIPVSLAPGEYPVYPNQSPYSDCSNVNVTSSYSMGSFYAKYQAIGGTFKLISIDTVQKKLEAEFNIDYQDPADASHVLHLSNGKLHLVTFDPL